MHSVVSGTIGTPISFNGKQITAANISQTA